MPLHLDEDSRCVARFRRLPKLPRISAMQLAPQSDLLFCDHKQRPTSMLARAASWQLRAKRLSTKNARLLLHTSATLAGWSPEHTRSTTAGCSFRSPLTRCWTAASHVPPDLDPLLLSATTTLRILGPRCDVVVDLFNTRARAARRANQEHTQCPKTSFLRHRVSLLPF